MERDKDYEFFGNDSVLNLFLLIVFFKYLGEKMNICYLMGRNGIKKML